MALVLLCRKNVVTIFFHRDSELVPADPNPNSLVNARFGSSVACLGSPDTRDSSVLVVVGAPYFKSV